jgi:hypothetical protein
MALKRREITGSNGSRTFRAGTSPAASSRLTVKLRFPWMSPFFRYPALPNNFVLLHCQEFGLIEYVPIRQIYDSIGNGYKFFGEVQFNQDLLFLAEADSSMDSVGPGLDHYRNRRFGIRIRIEFPILVRFDCH